MEEILTTINQFKNVFTSVRPTLYKVKFPLPAEDNPFIKNEWIDTSDKAAHIYFFCKQAKLPSSKVNERATSYFGRNYYESADRNFELLEITFYNSQDFGIRNWIEEWMKKINQRNENDQPEEVKDTYNYYLPSIEIEQLNRRNEVIKTYIFFYIFPIECSEIPLDFGATNQIEEFTVQFRYQWWEEVHGTAEKSQSINPPTGNNKSLLPNAISDNLKNMIPNSATQRTLLNNNIQLNRNVSPPSDGILSELVGDIIPVTFILDSVAASKLSKNLLKVHFVHQSKVDDFQEENKTSNFTKISVDQLKKLLSSTSQQKLESIDFSKFSIFINI